MPLLAILRPLLPYLVGAIAIAAVALWLRHGGAESERQRGEAERAAVITRNEEARRAADTAAATALDPADGLRQGGWLRD